MSPRGPWLCRVLLEHDIAHRLVVIGTHRVVISVRIVLASGVRSRNRHKGKW
jgi:hypothetical protein